MFDIDKWVEERKARWAEICALSEEPDTRDLKDIMGWTEEEYRNFLSNN